MEGSNWLRKLFTLLDIVLVGQVLDNVNSSLEMGEYCVNKVKASLDDQLKSDIEDWWKLHFEKWFLSLTVRLQHNSYEEIFTQSYLSEVYKVLEALQVSRAYYEHLAEDSFYKGVKDLHKMKANIMEECYQAILEAYSKAVLDHPNSEFTVQHKLVIVEADEYPENTPELFSWGKDIVVNFFKPVLMTEKDQKCAKPLKDYVPWAITGFACLIAWTASASKNKE